MIDAPDAQLFYRMDIGFCGPVLKLAKQLGLFCLCRLEMLQCLLAVHSLCNQLYLRSIAIGIQRLDSLFQGGGLGCCVDPAAANASQQGFTFAGNRRTHRGQVQGNTDLCGVPVFLG